MRARTTKLVFSSLILLPIAISCSADEAKHVSVEPRVAEFVEALCGAAYRCCTQGEVGYYLGLFVNEDNCSERLTAASEVAQSIGLNANILAGDQVKGPLKDLVVTVPNLGSLDRAVREGRTKIDPEGLSTCIEFLGDVGCNEPPEKPSPGKSKCVPPEPPAEKSPCDARKIFVGLLGKGEACTSDGKSFECAPGLLCARNPALGEKGQCAFAALEGEECLVDAQCGEGLYCSMLDGTCMKPREENEPCVFADHLDPSPEPETLLVKCREDLSCDPITDTCVAHCQPGAECESDVDCDEDQELECITGRCDRKRKKGLPCADDEDCEEGLQCAADPVELASGLCQDRLAVGASCTARADCDSDFCDPATQECSPQAAPGDPCPSRLDAECAGGLCQMGTSSCLSDTDCPNVTTCDPIRFECRPYCVALSQDGASCLLDGECSSDACIAGYCRTPPLGENEECTSDDQCDSSYCGLETDHVCTELPLPVGAACRNASDCESLVCITSRTGLGLQPTCAAGLGDGDLCGPEKPPCDPKAFFCDMEKDPPQCVPFLETGEICKRSAECRSQGCTVSNGRLLCSPAAKPDLAICDGEE